MAKQPWQWRALCWLLVPGAGGFARKNSQSNEKMFEDGERLIIYSNEELIGHDIDKSVEEEREGEGWKWSAACCLHSVSVSTVYQGSWGERRIFQIDSVIVTCL